MSELALPSAYTGTHRISLVAGTKDDGLLQLELVSPSDDKPVTDEGKKLLYLVARILNHALDMFGQPKLIVSGGKSADGITQYVLHVDPQNPYEYNQDKVLETAQNTMQTLQIAISERSQLGSAEILKEVEKDYGTTDAEVDHLRMGTGSSRKRKEKPMHEKEYPFYLRHEEGMFPGGLYTVLGKKNRVYLDINAEDFQKTDLALHYMRAVADLIEQKLEARGIVLDLPDGEPQGMTVKFVLRGGPRFPEDECNSQMMFQAAREVFQELQKKLRTNTAASFDDVIQEMKDKLIEEKTRHDKGVPETNPIIKQPLLTEAQLDEAMQDWKVDSKKDKKNAEKRSKLIVSLASALNEQYSNGLLVNEEIAHGKIAEIITADDSPVPPNLRAWLVFQVKDATCAHFMGRNKGAVKE